MMPAFTGTAGQQRRASWWIVRAVALTAGVAAVLLLTWPQLFGAQRLLGIAQAIAFRGPFVAVLLIAAVIAASLFLVFRRRARQTARVAAGIAVVALAAAVGNLGVLLARGYGETSATSLPDGDLTVLVWNTQGGATPPADVAELVVEVGADIVSLPEMDEDAAAEVVSLVAREGMSMTAATTRTVSDSLEESWIPTSLLVADELGTYVLDDEAGSTPGLPSGVWRPADGVGPVIVAAHPLPPLPDSMDGWNVGLQWITRQCETFGEDVIIAGDVNATIDHLDLGSCQDAAAAAGTAAVGSWPVTAPAWLGSPIDHVLAGPAWAVRDARVISRSDTTGTDHRAFVAVLDAR